MKPVKIRYYQTVAQWAEGDDVIETSPHKEVCQRAIDEYDGTYKGYPYHGFRIDEKHEEGYIVDEE
jgi:hypothetical protein